MGLCGNFSERRALSGRSQLQASRGFGSAVNLALYDKLGYPMSLMTTSKILRCTRHELFAMAEKINESSTGKVIVLAAAHVDGAFRAVLALYAETMAGIELLIGTLEQKQQKQ